MRFFRIIFIQFLFLLNISCRTSNSKENLKIFSKTENNWEFFELEKEIEVKILNHLPSPALCGNLAFASVTLVETRQGDTIRILDLCNTLEYNKDLIVKVLPESKPEFGVLYPHRMFLNQKTNKYEYFESDLKTLKTTYGKILKK